MRKSFCLLLLIFYVFSTGIHAQSFREKVGKKLLKDDSTLVRLQRSRDSLLAAENRNAYKFNSRSFLRLAKEQEERRKKQKRWAFIRLGVGILLLTSLIIGWNRRRKKSITSK